MQRRERALDAARDDEDAQDCGSDREARGSANGGSGTASARGGRTSRRRRDGVGDRPSTRRDAESGVPAPRALKRAAHHAVHKALTRGELRRQRCEVCGGAHTHAHHDDYSRPLDVRWLCAGCHRRHHAGLRPYHDGESEALRRVREAVARRDRSRRFSRAAIVRARESGNKLEDIARAAGVSRQAISKTLRESRD